MRSVIAVVLCTVAIETSAQSLQFHGLLTARGVRVRAPSSWGAGGAGAFDVSGNHTANLNVAQLGVDWSPATWILVHGDGVARNGRAAGGGDNAGIVQAYVDVFNDHWRLRAGHFWLPTSRENVDPLWTSRYTITFSALNTWIGQEVRPVGADLQYSPNFYLTLGVTAFRDNDTMGTLLAARGWTLGNRLTVYDEVVPSKPVTTKPFGHDLDGKTGYAERIRVQLPERAMLQATHVDNRAELDPGRVPNVPWLTRYDSVGTTIGTMSPTTFAAEWASGDTTIGFPRGTFTLGFNTAYALLSHKYGAERVTVRVERYATDFEHKHAFTIAGFHDVNPRIRAGLEYVRASGPNGGNAITLELRYAF
jgi:hypothetical protein